MAMLSLKVFHPASDKVRQVEFHPVLPWIVSATKSDHVCVWDWRTKQVVWEAQLGGSDDDTCADAELARLHLRDPAFAPNPSLLHPIPTGSKREPSGHVRDVRFLDTDVAQVHLAWQHAMSAGCGSPPPRAEEIRTLLGQRLLVIACEARVLVVNLANRRVTELGRALLEGKAPTSLAFLLRSGAPVGLNGAHNGHGNGFSGGPGYHGPTHQGGLLESPVLAVGCADGVVRCLQLYPVKPVGRLVSAHKTPVVAMAAVGHRGQRLESLVVGHQGGSVALYEPLFTGGRSPVMVGPGESSAPRADVKAHDRELLPGSLVAGPLAEDPEETRCLLYTAGSDHRVCGLDPASLKEIAKVKVERAPLTCMAAWPRGYAASGVHCMLLGTEGGHLLLAHPPSGSVRLAMELEGIVPAGHKRVPKVYGLHVHPTMPGLVAVASNTGTAVLTLAAPQPPLPVAPLPLMSPAQALHDGSSGGAAAFFGGGGGGGGGGATYVTAMGPKVFCVTAEALPNQAHAEFAPNQVVGKLQVATDTPPGRALLSVSADGSHVAVSWPGARQYAVYRQGASAWSEVVRGHGTSVAWHCSRSVFAALEEEPPAAPALPVLGGKSFKDQKKAEKQAEAARAAMEAAAKAAAATAAVRIRELRGADGVGGGPLGPPGGTLDLHGDMPSFVQGGPLLAVTVRRSIKSESLELSAGGRGGDGAPHALHLYDWLSGRRVGPELPEPLHMAWDPSRTMLALAYPSQLLVLRVQPDFQVVTTLPVSATQSLEWAARQLYIATPTHILCALLAPAAPHVPTLTATSLAAAPPLAASAAAAAAANAAPARLIVLAGPGVQTACTSGAAVQEGLLPPPAVRPPGPLTLLGPRDACLWMVGVMGQPLALALAHPGLRCCCLVASGDLQGAVTLAARALAPELHDQLAALMTDMDGLRGAAAAATLPGISLATELRLRTLMRHWQQAVEAAEAMLLGYSRRPPPGGFASAVAAAAFGSGAGRGVGGAMLGDEFVDVGAAAGGMPASAPAHPEDLDWTQPLREASSSAKAAAAATVAARGPGHTAAITVAAPCGGGGGAPTAVTIQLVLGLLEDLIGAAMYDVARHLAKALVVHAVNMPGEQLLRVAAVMAQAGMKTDLPALAHSVSAGGDSSSRESAALMAAMLSGHTALVQDSLREGGAQPLAALQARVYGLSAAAESMAVWRRQLAAAAPGGSSAALGRLDVGVAG
ncbi:hypothetical protein Agub_g3993 [Astrephomene gubernaculifera]|uniref:Uncharacterized protein n=1 Tax=Astrephomene gubernaculifera TaxID=47775 RepID=A0AAD3HIW3_9CHLO|nr:hypothetical protein Agub_g3993 [Astrephomene gubernaculifera]